MKKCPFCAEEIQEEAIVCRYCGHDLVPQQQIPTTTQKPTTPTLSEEEKRAKRKHNNKVLGIIVFITFFVVCVLPAIFGAFNSDDKNTAVSEKTQIAAVVETSLAENAESLYTATPANTTTPLPTPTFVYVDPSKSYPPANPDLYREILANKNSMTDLQFKDYLNSVVGQRLYIKAQVVEVLESGKVYLEGDAGGFFDNIYLSGLPNDLLLQINKGAVLEFDATIREFEEFIFTRINLDDPLLYSIH